MTAENPRTRTFSPSRVGRSAGLALLALAGASRTAAGHRGGEPRPARLRPQPHPPAERAASRPRRRRDQGDEVATLLERPAGKNGDRSGVGYNDDPERFKGTHIPGLGSTPAALAGKTKDGDELKIDTPDNRVPLRPAGGIDPD